MKTNRIILIMVVVLVASFAPKTDAELVSLPLDCAGTYDAGPSYWESDFDFGVTFSSIEHVYIDWAGEITAGLAVFDDEPGMDPLPIDVGICTWNQIALRQAENA